MITQPPTTDQVTDSSRSDHTRPGRHPTGVETRIDPSVSAAAAAAVMVMVMVMVMVVAIAFGGSTVAVAAAMISGAAAALVDLRTRRIPNRLVLLAAVAAGAGIASASIAGDRAAVVAAMFGVLGFAGPLLAVHLAAPSAIGFGDVKLAGALGAALGLLDPRFGLLALCVATGVTGAVGIIARRPTLPLGPGLVVGAVASAALGSWVLP